MTIAFASKPLVPGSTEGNRFAIAAGSPDAATTATVAGQTVPTLDGGAGDEARHRQADDARPAVLQWQHFPTDEAGFFHTPVLITGARDAVLLDGTFRFSEARKIVEAVMRSGKKLTTVYVSCNDPDFYFGLKPLLETFPAARLIANPVTVAAIEANIDEKLAVWRDKIGDDGPASRADVAVPMPCDDVQLTVDGERIDIITHPGMADRRTHHVPALKAIFGGTMVVSGGHVWMADTPQHATILAWIAALDGLIALDPKIVVPGHFSPGGTLDAGALRFTRDYLLAFEDERAKATDSTALVAAMDARYPGLPGTMWLELGAKVLLGETTWATEG